MKSPALTCLISVPENEGIDQPFVVPTPVESPKSVVKDELIVEVSSWLFSLVAPKSLMKFATVAESAETLAICKKGKHAKTKTKQRTVRRIFDVFDFIFLFPFNF